MDDIEFLEKQTPDEKFQYTFNSGYTLAKYQPEVLEQILFEIEQNNLHGMEGFKWGKWQYEQERSKEHVNEFARIRSLGRDKDRNHER